MLTIPDVLSMPCCNHHDEQTVIYVMENGEDISFETINERVIVCPCGLVRILHNGELKVVYDFEIDKENRL